MPTPDPRTLKRKAAAGRAVHDVGGLDLGPIDRSEHDLALWEKRVDAMLILLVGPRKKAFTLDAQRRVIEDYGQQQYDRTTYYEKWVRAIRNLVVEQEILTREEVEARMAEVAKRMAAAGRPVAKGAIPWDALEALTAKPAQAWVAAADGKPAKPAAKAKARPAKGKRGRP